MKYFIIAILFFITSVGFTSLGFGEEITLNEYLDLVKSNHPFFTKEELSIAIEKKEAESLPGAEDWIFSVAPGYNYYEASAPEYGGQTRVHQVGVEADLNRLLWSTGGKLGFSITSGYFDADAAPFSGPSKYYKHGISVSYSHPLLQNSRGKLDRLPYELSAYTIDITSLRVYENQENFLLDIAVKYLDWVYFGEAVKIAQERLALAKQQLEQVQKKYKANLVDRVDVLRAEDSVRIAGQSVLQIEAQWKSKQAELAVIAGSDQLYKKTPSFELYSIEEIPRRDEAGLKARSRTLQAFKILKDQLVEQRTGLVEQQRAQLDVNLGVGVFGSDETFGKSLEIYHPDASVSLVFSKVLGGRTLKEQIEKLDLQVQQVEKDMKSMSRQLESSTVSILIRVVEMEKVLALNKAQVQSAREKTDEELKLYNRGRSQLTFVIQSRDNEENAKLNYAENASVYHTLLLQYRAILDELLAVDEEEGGEIK